LALKMNITRTQFMLSPDPMGYDGAGVQVQILGCQSDR
jgi:hypothetical protein